MNTLYLVTVVDRKVNRRYSLVITATTEAAARALAEAWLNPKHDDKILSVEAICKTPDDVDREV